MLSSAKPSRSTAIVSLAACIAAGPQIVGAQERQKLRFCGVPTDDLTPIFWGIKNGTYAKIGLDVEFVPMASGTTATQAVIAGTYELGKGSSVAALIAHLKGIPVVIVGNGILWEQSNKWSLGLVRKDEPWKTGADLNNKTIAGTALGDLLTLGIRGWVDQNGGDSKTIKWVEIPNSIAGEALIAGRIDVCQLMEPQLHAALATGKVRIFAPFLDSIAPYYALTIYMARPDWANANRATVDRWVKTTYELAQFTNSHPAETIELTAATLKMPVEIFKTMTRVHAATTSDPNLTQPVINMAAKYGSLERAFPAKEVYFSG
jgi:NitT/TauT family transport system substrate-binding protein